MADYSKMDNRPTRPAPMDAVVPTASKTRAATASLPLSAKSPPSKTTVDWKGTFFDLVGGHPTFRKLVDVFYAGVADDDLLVAMYPEKNLEPAKERLLFFLEQYWGGPDTYSRRRGHPRLRARHAAFTITPTARDHWLKHMRSAVDGLDLSEDLATTLWGYLEQAAHAMVNAA